MSSISKVDAKETNSTELINIPEGPELIDVSDIQLDKTSVETYMNDFNKNFYNIKFSKKLLTDYYELYNLENYGINTKDVNDKDIRNKSYVDEENNIKKDYKQIQATPIGLPGLISSKNHSSINNSIEKTLKDATVAPCVGLSYSANLSSIFDDDNTKWTIKSENLPMPIDLNTSIPGFKIASLNIDLKAFGSRIGYSGNCDEVRKNTLFDGFSALCTGTYTEQKCRRTIIGKWCWDVLKFKTAEQIYYADHTYSPKELMNFNGLGVKFNAVIDASFELQFQLVTNIPIGLMLSALQAVDNQIYEKVKNKTNVNDIITTLTENINFAYILKIMKGIVVKLVEQQVNGIYIEFYITHIGIKLNLLVNQFSMYYGGNIYSPICNSSFNTSFNLLTSGQYISFSLNPASLEITAEFVLYQGKLHELLHSLSSLETKNYLTNNVNSTGITGASLAKIIIAHENIVKNNARIAQLDNMYVYSIGRIEERKNLVDKNTILKSTIDGILNKYKEFKTIHYGNSSNPISKIIDKFNPTIKISMMLCTAGIAAAFLGCVSITLPADIIQFVKDSVYDIITALPTLKFADKIPSKYENHHLFSVSTRNKIRKFNDDVDKTNDILNNGVVTALNETLNMLGNTMVVTPSVQLCVPYAVV